MIAGLSKAVTLYLTPLLALTAIILSILAFLAPTLILHDQVSLLSVVPSNALFQQNAASTSVDGPTVFIGVLGMLFATDRLNLHKLKSYQQVHVPELIMLLV